MVAPDAAYGEKVVAFVVLRNPARSPADADRDLLVHCRDRLARFKVPAQIKVLKELPKNAVEKVVKQELKGAV